MSEAITREQALENLRLLRATAKARKIRVDKNISFTAQNFRLRNFRQTYRHDPLAFVHDIIKWKDGEKLSHYQERALGELPNRQRLAMYSPRGAGKSATLSLAQWWGITTVEDVKIPITAGDWGQLEKYLWPEIHKWGLRLDWDKIGMPVPIPSKQIMRTDIVLTPTALTRTASPEDPAKFEGAHASDRIMLIYDEAKVVRQEMFDAGEGSFNGSPNADKLVLAFSTPSAPMGRFYDICVNRENRYSDWYVIHVTKDDMIKAGRMTQEFADARAKQWGVDSALYRNQIEGEFAADAVNTAIPWNYVEAAMQRWTDLNDSKQLATMPMTALACDPAAGGGDKTIMAIRGTGKVIKELKEFDYRSTMDTKRQIETEVGGNKEMPIYLDVIGIGAGIFDSLVDDGYKVYPFNAGAAPDNPPDPDMNEQVKFLNKRAESWWQFHEVLDPDKGQEAAIPNDDLLKGELTAPVWQPAEGGKKKLQSKEDLRKKLGRSTDHADPVIMALVGDAVCQPYETDIAVGSVPWGNNA